MAPTAHAEFPATEAHCNTCGGETQHDVLVREKWPIREGDATGILTGEATTELFRCRGCWAISLRQTEDWGQPEGPDAVLLYPPPVTRRSPDWVAGLPEDVPTLMGEIYRALTADCRALAMMGARALIDRVLRDSVGDNGPFEQRLNRLVESGAVGPKDRELLETALEAGHAASHRGYQPTTDTLNHVMDIVEHLLQSQYVLPAEAAKVAESTPTRPRGHDKPAKVVGIKRDAAR